MTIGKRRTIATAWCIYFHTSPHCVYVLCVRHHEPSTGSYLSNLQARPPLFGDNNNTTADDWSQDRNHPDSATAAPAVPTHGDNRSNDRSDLVGSNGAGEQRTRRGSPRLLRHLLLTRQPQPPPQPQPQSTSTVTPSCQPNRSHCDERAAGTVRDDEWRSCLGDMDIVLSSTPSRRSRAGDLAEACRTRMGGEAKRGAEERGSSTASIGSVGSELRGGELERVRGRVADLSAAIETSQVRNSRFRYRDFFIPLMTFFLFYPGIIPLQFLSVLKTNDGIERVLSRLGMQPVDTPHPFLTLPGQASARAVPSAGRFFLQLWLHASGWIH